MLLMESKTRNAENKTKQLMQALEQAEAIIIGAGAGLSLSLIHI